MIQFNFLLILLSLIFWYFWLREYFTIFVSLCYTIFTFKVSHFLQFFVFWFLLKFTRLTAFVQATKNKEKRSLWHMRLYNIISNLSWKIQKLRWIFMGYFNFGKKKIFCLHLQPELKISFKHQNAIVLLLSNAIKDFF